MANLTVSVPAALSERLRGRVTRGSFARVCFKNHTWRHSGSRLVPSGPSTPRISVCETVETVASSRATLQTHLR